MSKMNNKYGSELHLRSLLATKTERIADVVLSALKSADLASPCKVIWHPAYLQIGEPEIRGLDFLDATSSVRIKWKTWWPQRGNVHNWDGLGEVQYGDGRSEWLLMEAKANLQEVRSDCHAKEQGGLPLIRERLKETQVSAKVATDRDWTKRYYQYANRLALLYFLHSQGVAARVMFVYFTGDRGDEHRVCPRNKEEWTETLANMKEYLGLNGKSELEKHVHEIFVAVETV